MMSCYNDILTIDDLCEILEIGKSSAYNLLKSGELKAFRIGKVWKIPKKSVENYILSKI